MANKLVRDIKKLKEEKKAIILAHNYQIDEVQEVADYVGDSLGLSRKAAVAEAETVVFCGVDFMAESAAILCPEKEVLLPEKEATCPLAEKITRQDLRAKKERYPAAVVVCYVNSSAAIKAESDVCCTSFNAVEIVSKLENDQILFVPDQNLGQHVQVQTKKEVILWPGNCFTHHQVRSEDMVRIKELYPTALIAVHPECKPEIAAEADFVGSTAQILDFARELKDKPLIIGTEMGLMYRLRNENPNQKFHLLNQGLVCKNMKITSLADIKASLKKRKFKVKVSPSVRKQARAALDKMFALTS